MQELVVSNGSSGARSRILDVAYELFSRRGVRDVSIDEVIERSRTSATEFASEFPTKDDLILAVLEAREQRWTVEKVEAGALAAGSTPEEQLLGIFDVFDGWFRADDFDACTFINVLLEMGWDHPLGQASITHLENIRSMVSRLAAEAGLAETDEFARSWHILMKGAIISAAEGDFDAAKRARAMAVDLIAKYRT